MSTISERFRNFVDGFKNKRRVPDILRAVELPAEAPELTPNMSIDAVIARTFMTGKTIVQGIDENGKIYVSESDGFKPK